MKSIKRVLGVSLILLGLLSLFFSTASSRAETRTDRGRATVQAAQAATPTPGGDTLVWQARLVDVVPDVVLGGGAILRVYVKDHPGEQIEVQLEDVILHNTSGTKPEYGPDAAEFAPLQGGLWRVSLPAFGVSIPVQTDYRSLFIVEFYQVPAAQATAASQGTATPTPLGGVRWEGRVVSQTQGPSVAGALLRVKVEGRAGEPVDLRTFTDFIGQGVTGSKPDLESDTVEFAGLAKGQYSIIPLRLNAQITVDLDINTTTIVVFSPIQSAPEPTPTATPRPIPSTATPPPASPPNTATPTVPPSATPTAEPLQRWVVLVEEREAISQLAPRLIVRVEDRRDETVLIQQRGVEGEVTCQTGPISGYEPYGCELPNLKPGIHLVSWPAGDLSSHIELKENEMVVVAFTQETAPSEETIWQAEIIRNSSRALPTDRQNSQIEIQIGERIGQVVSLLNSKHQRRLCETNQTGSCRFIGLEDGVYTIEPVNILATQSLFVDGVGSAQVRFSEVPLSASAAPAPATPIVGQGAIPKPTQAGGGFIRATDTPEPTPPATATVTATRPATSTPIPTPTLRPQPPTPTATFSPTPTIAPTPTLAQGWLGRVVEDYEHPGQTIIVSAPLGDHPIILQSGGWQVENRTGTKPELGPGVAEFAGLAPGDYTIILVNLAEIKVRLETDHFLHVNFSYGPLPAPTPTPQPGQWTAAILSNTSGPTGNGGVWSILTIQIGGVNNLPVQVRTDGFQTECITGTKPELGDGVCQIGGLWPATYHVEPAGLPINIDVSLDGVGAAWVAFWQQ